MKKMQCEVCGSSEIKKIDDTTFECQSCGVQYDKAEVQKLLVEITGKVKIDHSDEVDNHIKRAEQFEEAGNIKKAEEHYNAALDLDASNESAQEKIKNISKKSKYENFFIVDAKMDDEETVKHLLREMATIENIVCDIYKEIEIKKITNKYNVFAFLKGKYKCTWSAVLCHREYENQTVYKDKWDKEKQKYVKEPTTEKVERIRRVPSNGERVYDTEGLVMANNILKGINHSHSDATINALSSDFENLQDNKYCTYTVTKLDSRHITEENGKKLYKGMEISFDADEKIITARKQGLLESADRNCADEVTASMGCDFYENMSATRETLSESTAYVCIPVQVIEYTYKSKTYLAVCDLVSHTTTISKIYPEDIVLAKTKKGLNKDKTYSEKMPGLFWLGLLAPIIGVILIAIGDSASDYDITEIYFAFGFILMLAGIALMIVAAIQKSNRAKAFQNKTRDLQTSIYIPRMKFLANSYGKFFGTYKDISSLLSASSSVSAEGIVEMVEVQEQISYSGKIEEFIANFDNVMFEDERKIAELESEIEELKKKRTLPIVLMVVSCFIIFPLFLAGLIMLGNTNQKIINKTQELNKLKGDWIH